MFFLLLNFNVPLRLTAQAVDFYTWNARWKFTKALYEFGDYKGSIKEANSILDTVRDLSISNKLDSLRWILAKCYFRSEKWDEGFVQISKISTDSPDLFAYSKLALSFNAFFKKSGGIDTILINPIKYDIHLKNAPTQLKDYHNYLKLTYHLLKKEWPEYERLRLLEPLNYQIKTSQEQLYSIYKKRTNTRKKSPWVAGALSLVIPGGGQAYLGKWGQALGYFATSSILFLQAFEGSYKHSDLQKYTFSFLFVGAHFMGTYNAALSAKMYNRQIDKRYQTEINEEISKVFKSYLWD